jgi:hypothetical protein
MQNTAHALRDWSKKLFDNARIELHMANEVIHHLDMAQDQRPLTTAEF